MKFGYGNALLSLVTSTTPHFLVVYKFWMINWLRPPISVVSYLFDVIMFTCFWKCQFISFQESNIFRLLCHMLHKQLATIYVKKSLINISTLMMTPRKVNMVALCVLTKDYITMILEVDVNITTVSRRDFFIHWVCGTLWMADGDVGMGVCMQTRRCT